MFLKRSLLSPCLNTITTPKAFAIKLTRLIYMLQATTCFDNFDLYRFYTGGTKNTEFVFILIMN